MPGANESVESEYTYIEKYKETYFSSRVLEGNGCHCLADRAPDSQIKQCSVKYEGELVKQPQAEVGGGWVGGIY